MAGIKELLFGPPATTGSNDPDISMFLSNLKGNQKKNYPSSQDGPIELPSYGNEMEAPPMEGLLKYHYATADATGVAHDNIDAELAQNRQDKLEKIIHQSKEEGSIRALPYLQTAEGQQTMLDMVTRSSGGAIGRMSKAAVTGGQRFIDPLFKQMTTGKPISSALKSSKQFIDNIKWDNKTNAARLAWEKAMKRWGVRPTERVVNDPVTELLRSQKGSRFSPHRKN